MAEVRYVGSGQEFSFQEIFEMDEVGCEFANPFGELFGSHGVLVHEPAERFFLT